MLTIAISILQLYVIPSMYLYQCPEDIPLGSKHVATLKIKYLIVVLTAIYFSYYKSNTAG
jgi:hypothetical protein